MNSPASFFASRRLAAITGLAVVVVSGCAIERKAECVAARDCDQARDAPYNAFEDADEAFGETGSCWQTEDTAAPCVAACTEFVADQLAAGTAGNNRGLNVACGGEVEGL